MAAAGRILLACCSATLPPPAALPAFAHPLPLPRLLYCLPGSSVPQAAAVHGGAV